MAKNFKKMDNIEKKIFDLKIQIQMKLSEKNYANLVQLIFSLKNELNSLKNNTGIKDIE